MSNESSRLEIRTVTVVGATGVMGANVAGIFASFGNARVYCVGREIEKVRKAIPRIIKSVRAGSIAAKLIPADLSMLDACVAESDLVFESTFENAAVKADIASRIAKAMRPGTLSCTGTSGLSITALAECYPASLRGQFFGVHMFNPPYSMSLCELISTPYSDKELHLRLRNYLENVLYRLIRYDNGLKRQTVYDLNTGTYRDQIPYVFPFADKMKKYIADGDYIKAFEELVHNRSQEAEICLSFLLKYIVYSLYAAKEVGTSVHAADDVMAAGYNWCPPLALYEALSSVADVKALVRERLTDISRKIDMDRLLSEAKPSAYDYRQYFRTGRR